MIIDAKMTQIETKSTNKNSGVCGFSRIGLKLAKTKLYCKWPSGPLTLLVPQDHLDFPPHGDGSEIPYISNYTRPVYVREDFPYIECKMFSPLDAEQKNHSALHCFHHSYCI